MDNSVIIAEGYYDGHQAKGNFEIQLKVKFLETDLANALQFVAGIGKQVQLIAKVTDEKIKLGTFNIYNIVVDRNATCKIQFRSNTDYVKVENLSKLMVDETSITFMGKVISQE